jgi:hypothetical protein
VPELQDMGGPVEGTSRFLVTINRAQVQISIRLLRRPTIT